MITAVFLHFSVILVFYSFLALYEINRLVAVPLLPRLICKSDKIDIRDVRYSDALKHGQVICSGEQITGLRCLLQIPIYLLLIRARSDKRYKYYTVWRRKYLSGDPLMYSSNKFMLVF